MQQSPTTPVDYTALLQRAPHLQPYHLTTMAPNGEQVRVALGNAATWRKFSRQNTEMIVTKVGRRMFPSLSLDIRGLDPVRKYEVYITLMLADRHTLKYQRGVWLANGQGETYPPPGCTAGLAYLHPDSPASGRHWTRQEVTFMRLKLTNKLDVFASEPSRNGSMIFTYSMHKYRPVVHIRELTSGDGFEHGFYTALTFPGTEFITVTAYQNPELTDLKIQFNPYAKGIRNQGDRSGPLLIDSFRPTVQALQQQLQLPAQPEQHRDIAASTGSESSAVEFGAYPDQTDTSYGQWPSQQQEQRHRRLHRPYYTVQSSPMMLPPASSAPTYGYPVATHRYLDYQPQPELHHQHQQQQQPHQLGYQTTSYYAEAASGLNSGLSSSFRRHDNASIQQHLSASHGTAELSSLLSTPLQQQQQVQQQQQQQHYQSCQPASAATGHTGATDSSSLSAVSFSSPPNCDF